MMAKVAILTLVAISINGCFGIPVIRNCSVVNLEADIQATTCGSTTETRDTNGTLIDIQYYANETLSVIQLGNDKSSCYIQRSVALPDGIDYVEATETDVRAEASVEVSNAIVALVPECAGRSIYELLPEASDPATGRKKRGCGYFYRCYYFRIRSGWFYRWYRYCRYLFFC
ncbi:uncharacterized protein [Haliotis cracherodii]|uniref:uncharacterized protein n=1 Tax=Haliotis cracherodii TaxID=6455 RepID=UPI0039E7F305